MKTIKVKYTVNPEYVEQNKANIRKVMQKLREEPIEGMLYSSYTMDDGNTFVHINIARNQESIDKLNEMQEFREFQMALRESKPIIPPQATKLELVDAGFEL